MLSILFLCTGNTCRSPMAEALFNVKLQETGLPFKVKASSAGLSAFEGQAVTDPVHRLLAAEGIDIVNHKARQVNLGMIENADLIFTMTRSQHNELVFRFPSAGEKCFVLKAYVGVSDEVPDIEDPIGCGLEKYQAVLEEIRESVKKLTLKFAAGNGR